MPISGLPLHTPGLPPTAVGEIAQAIQLSVVPVFLLAGIGALLSVLTARLGRVIDRARKLESEFTSLNEFDRQCAAAELNTLDRRMVRAHLAVYFCTATALVVCLLIAALFIASLTGLAIGRMVAMLFIVAMALIITGLLFFMAEIRIARQSVRVRRHILLQR